MNDSIRILIVEDQLADVKPVQREVRRAMPSSVFEQVAGHDECLVALEHFRPDLVIAGDRLPSLDGMTTLRLALLHVPRVPVIILADASDEDAVAAYMKSGASPRAKCSGRATASAT